MAKANGTLDSASITFALADGANFDNVGRGYILRRLLRRSVRYGKKLVLNEKFMYKLVDSVVLNMKDVYPYLLTKQAHIKALIMQEEDLFLKMLNEAASDAKHLNLTGLAPGIYFLRVLNAAGELLKSERILKVD